MSGFDHRFGTRLVFGPGTVTEVGQMACQLGAQRVLLVTDPGICRAGHASQVQQLLAEVGLKVTVFDQVHENPTTGDIDACVKVATLAGIELIVGLGGGSSLDTAKGCNFVLTNGGRMADYWGFCKANRPMLPMIAIPTTAGTGSEVQSYALIADAASHQKMACGDPKAAPVIAVLDPTLTITQPRHVTANTGLDAIAHAVESFVTTSRTPISQMYARESLRLTAWNLSRVLHVEGSADLTARGDMQLGAALAGLAVECSMLGAAHSAANPLTAHLGIAHGQAVVTMLPHVIRFNAEQQQTRQQYAQLAREVGMATADADDEEAVEHVLQAIEQLMQTAGLLPIAIEGHLEELAEEAAGQWTAQFNPRPVQADDFVHLYRKAARSDI